MGSNLYMPRIPLKHYSDVTYMEIFKIMINFLIECKLIILKSDLSYAQLQS
jgi:hypothetical protein